MTAVSARNIKFISHCDQGGRGDGVQIMVHRGYAYIGHGFSNGITVVDVRDPKRPKTVNFLPCPPNTRALHLQTHDDLLLAVNAPSMWTMQVSEKAYFSGSPANLLQGQERTFTSGMRVYDISQPATPREIAFMPVDGIGPHRIWYVGGLTVLDVANPTQPTLLSHRNLDPPFGGGTHSPLPLPERNLLVLADEPNFANCSQGLRYIWVFDVRAPTNPVSIATLPIPADDDYCAKGGNFGAHNLWENRPGGFQSSRLIFATYYNAGVRAYDIDNPFQPREIGYYVPPNPERMYDPRPDRPQVIQSNDCFIDAQGVMYLTDANAGLNILQFEG